jgi:predicted NAD/FAD-dependent oxidoreductase
LRLSDDVLDCISMTRKRIVVVGAGITGLLIASGLRRAGRDVVVFEKSRGVGGRMATKRVGEAACDQGAQYFSARTLEFQGHVGEWQRRGLIRPWPGGEGVGGETRWVCVPSMTAIAKHLSEGLDVRRERKVIAVRQEGNGWILDFEGGETVGADVLVATSPVPQVLEWLKAGAVALDSGSRAVLESIAYEPCLTVVGTVDGPPNLPDPGYLALGPGADPVLGWLADNRRKGTSKVESVTVQANPEWSAANYNRTPDDIRKDLVAASTPLLGVNFIESVLHKWKFSRVVSAAPLPHWVHPAGNFLMAGDGFGGARIEGAACSAFSALRYLQGIVSD